MAADTAVNIEAFNMQSRKDVRRVKVQEGRISETYLLPDAYIAV